MRKLVFCGIVIAAASAAVTITGGRAQAGVIAPSALREAADQLRLPETVQFSWRPPLLLVQQGMARLGLVPLWLQFSTRHGMGRSGWVARMATARPAPGESSAEASAGNATPANAA